MKHTSRKQSSKNNPLTFEDLVRIENKPAKENKPEAMQSYKGIEGLIFNKSEKDIKPKLGFNRIDSPEDIAVWSISSSHSFRLGLPVRNINIVPQKRVEALLKDKPLLTQQGLHLPWNDYIYNPSFASKPTTSMMRRKNGKRIIPTSEIDGLIFGVDDRRVYYPKGYPYHCIGKVEVNDNGNFFDGTGTLVGRNLVLTARHVVPSDARNSSMKFTPAYYDGKSVAGESFYSYVEAAWHYDHAGAAWDMALLRLYQPLGDYLGYLGVHTYNDDWNDEPYWMACGYPAMIADGKRPTYLAGVEINDTDEDGRATELESENQDNSKGNSGGPLFATWPDGPYIVGVVSANEKTDNVIDNSYAVLNASGQAMVTLVALGRVEWATDIHIIRPPNLNLG